MNLKEKVSQLFENQLNDWQLASNSYKALDKVKVKTFDVDGQLYKVQFNPYRILSTSAKIDAKNIAERRCFLCQSNLPAEQAGVPFGENYMILVNPYPIFKRHLTIAHMQHVPQLIISRFGDMLDLAKDLDDYLMFYNGPKCGASIPEHFHIQAGEKGFLPIENNPNWRNNIRIKSENKEDMLQKFAQVYDSLPIADADVEPMLNIITWYDSNEWTVCIFPRKKHRPDCYFTGFYISPASVDLSGVFIMPLEKDFEKVTAEKIAEIVDEVAVKC